MFENSQKYDYESHFNYVYFERNFDLDAERDVYCENGKKLATIWNSSLAISVAFCYASIHVSSGLF